MRPPLKLIHIPISMFPENNSRLIEHIESIKDFFVFLRSEPWIRLAKQLPDNSLAHSCYVEYDKLFYFEII